MTRPRLFSTFDPANKGADLGLEDGNTIVVTTATTDLDRAVRGLYGKSSSAWFFEVAFYGSATLVDAVSVGVAKSTASLATFVGGDADGYGFRAGDSAPAIYNDGIALTKGSTQSVAGDIIGVLCRISDGTDPSVSFFLNGILEADATLSDAGPWFPAVTISSATADTLRAWINTGQRDFAFPVAGVPGWYELPVEVQPLRASTEGYITPSDDPFPNEVWIGSIADEGVEVVSELAFWPDGNARTTRGKAAQIRLANGNGQYDWLLETDVRDVAATLRAVAQGGSMDDATLVASLIVNEIVVVDDSLISVRLDSAMADYDQPLQSKIFPPSADPIVAGKPWPISLGAVFQSSPVLVDPVNRVYALSDSGVVGLGYFRDKGAPLDPVGPPAGYVISDDGLYVTLETEPEGKFTADISSVGGGTLPVLADDIWGGDGNPFSDAGGGIPAGFDTRNQATIVSTDKLLLTSTGLSSVAYLGESTATCLAGRSYRFHVDIQAIPGPHVYGIPVLSLQDASGGFPFAAWTATGVYEGVITAPYTFTPRVAFDSALTGSSATINSMYLLEIPDTYTPADINAITLTEFVREIVEERMGRSQSAWSRADTEAIDAATGYLGIGFNATTAMSARSAIEMAMSAYGACAWIDDNDVLRFTRLTDPELETPVGAITDADLTAEITVQADLAEGLSTQMHYRRNWPAMSDTDFVSDFITVTMATRRALSQPFQGIAASAIQLGSMYRHAVYADPVDTLLDAQADADAEIGRVVGYYAGRPRFFYNTEVSDELELELGQVWTLTSDRYGLSAGKNLLICKVTRRPIAGTIGLTLRG